MKDIHFKDNIVKKNKIAILIYNPVWIQLFENFKSKEMEVEIEKLDFLIKREKEIEKEIKEAEQRKKTLMNKILYISKEINENENKNAIVQMQETQQALVVINEKIPQLLEELEALPSLVDEQNTALLKETIKQGYALIQESKETSQKCQEELTELRQLLASLIKRKVDMDARVNKLYTFIHSMLGAVEMENLDKSFLTEDIKTSEIKEKTK